MTDLDTVRSWGRRMLDSIDWDGVFPLTLRANGWPDPAGKFFQEAARVKMASPPFPTECIFTASSVTIIEANGGPWALVLMQGPLPSYIEHLDPMDEWMRILATVHLNRGPLVPAASFECRKHPEEIWT